MCLKTHRTELKGNEIQSCKMYLGTSNENLSGRWELKPGNDGRREGKSELIMTMALGSIKEQNQS